jgi:hypothetical protein
MMKTADAETLDRSLMLSFKGTSVPSNGRELRAVGIASISAGVKVAMTGHFALPSVTGSRYLPCTLSQGAAQVVDVIAAIRSGAIAVAEAITGRSPITGRLPVSCEGFPPGSGVDIP